MAMFGTLKKPNPFGVDQAGQPIVAGDEPPVDMGDFTPAPPAKSGGFLADGSRGQAALGAFLDSIATQAGGQASFAPVMQRRQDRADALADWREKFEFQQANKAPPAPHYWESNDGSLGVVGPDGKPQILYKDPTPKIDWIQAKDPATGQITLYPMQQGGGGPDLGVPGANGAPTPPVGMPMGSPLSAAPNSRVIGDKQYWNIGGKWFDNPDGR